MFKKKTLKEKIPCYRYSTAKFPDFEKIPYFYETQILYVIEKIHNFICILRQIGHSLVIKKFKFKIMQFRKIVLFASKCEKRMR